MWGKTDMDVRLVASDLDGTIIRADGTISARTIEAFRHARESGMHIVFVTGRPMRWLDPVRRAFGHLGTVICSNGAVLYDLESESLVSAATIEPAALLEVREIILRAEPTATFAAETTRGLHLGTGFAEPGDTGRLGEIRALDLGSADLHEAGVVKFLAKSRTRDSDAFMAAVAGSLAELVSVTHSAFDVSLLEMAHVDVNKSVALGAYAAALGIGAGQVVAFGDMPNDLQMLSWAGHGYAMASGHPSARLAAAHLAPGVEDDGVARILEDILAGRTPETR
ncbi:haloacid dehalogenase [Arthrobacter sp. AQ5-05]|uniref:HAD hydrolase family protein n=1 Tax=Arthrobacter sp. AQ5-05 TaxID=2184581 RepID=UPI000DCE8057|nr:HAD hydrolase family protein [Arthrobacter sp. AQ5-05]RAX48412.1 haloacid dehalogenase [Arthrobacter sp. AQ5-05]